MSTLLCFGLGYSAEHFVARFGDGFDRIVGTVRGGERAAVLNARFRGRLKALGFDGTTATPELTGAIGEADVALVSIPQPRKAIRCWPRFRCTRWRTRSDLRSIVVSVHRRSLWRPGRRVGRRGTRRRGRICSARASGSPSNRHGRTSASALAKPSAILRLAGIYGPGRNALVQITRGDARRIVKPGQVFNHIHVGDIAQAIDAAFVRRGRRHFQCRRR